MRNFAKTLILTALTFEMLGCEYEKPKKTNYTPPPTPVFDAASEIKNIVKRINEELRAGRDDQTMDLEASGGQPGIISLDGALLLDEVNLDPRVSLTSQAGIGWRTLAPDVKPDRVERSVFVSQKLQKEFEVLENKKTFINFGCDISKRPELKDFTEVKTERGPFSLTDFYLAHTVLLCGKSTNQPFNITVVADTLVFSEFSNVSTDFTMLSFAAREIILENQNNLSLTCFGGSKTADCQNKISISAGKLSGDGTLKISSMGSNYGFF